MRRLAAPRSSAATLAAAPAALAAALDAARALSAATPASARASLEFPLADEKRSDWNYTPRRRDGLAWKDMGTRSARPQQR
jgi:hypothetical protein